MPQDTRTPAAPDNARAEPLWLRVAPAVFLVLWSGGYSAATVGLAYVEPITFLVLRYLLVLALLVPAMLLLRPALPQRPIDYLHLGVVGVLIQGFYFGLTNVAIGLGASAAGLAIVLALQPILVALVASQLSGETVGRLVWLGLGLGLAGAAIAILAKADAGSATVSGIVGAVLALLFITAGTLYEKRFGAPHHPVVSNAVQCTAALGIAVPLALGLETGRVEVTMPFLLALGYLALGNSIISMTLLFAMLRRGAASRASSLFFLVPPTSALIAWIVIDEPMPAAAWIGMAVAGVGVALVRRP